MKTEAEMNDDPQAGEVIGLLIESNASIASAMSKVLRDRLALSGLRAKIRCISPLPSDNGFEPMLNRMRQLLSKSVVDFVASDLNFNGIPGMGGAQNFGLRVLEVSFEVAPDIPRILFSSDDVGFELLQNPNRKFDEFFQKSTLLNGFDPKTSSQKLAGLIRVNPHAHLDDTSELGPEIYPYRVALQRLLRRATFTSTDAPDSTAVGVIRLTPLSGGRSTAKAYRMETWSTKGLAGIVGAAKLSFRKSSRSFDSDPVSIEYSHYQTYVKWFLPFAWRPEILAFVRTDVASLLIYSFGFGEGVDFETASSCIQRGDLSAVQNSIDQIFGVGTQRWYGVESRVKLDGQSLSEYYTSKFKLGGDQVDRALRCIEKSLNSVGSNVLENKFLVDGYRYHKPGNSLLSCPSGFLQCVVHGDLNTDNVLIAGSQVKFIDFQTTGLGHVFLDFAMYEVNIRLNCTSPSSLSEWFVVERRLGEDDAVLDEYEWVRLVREIRTNAALTFSNDQELHEHYWVAVGLCALRLLSLSSELMPDDKKNKLIACVLQSCNNFRERSRLH